MNSINDGFSLIWIYWYRKYMAKKQKKMKASPTTFSDSSSEFQNLDALKKKYKIQAIQSHPTITANIIQSKLQDLKLQTKSLTSISPLIYTINPELETKQIQQTILSNSAQGIKNQEIKQMINQLYSYYLNCKNIFIIYKEEKQGLVMEPLIKLINESSSLRTQRTNSNERIGYISQYFNMEDGGSYVERNQSLFESLDKIQNKIDGLEILDKFAELDGLEIWNAKYLGIPHSFLKIRKYTWTKSLNRPLLHPSQPKTVSDLPIIPRITKYRPSIDKLLPFVSYLKLLQKISPQSSPTIDSIFEYNNMPFIFIQDRIDRGGWQENYGVLCYYIVYGDEQNTLTQNYVKRWVQENSKTVLAQTIQEMNQRQKNRIKYINKESVSLGLGLFVEDLDHNSCIW